MIYNKCFWAWYDGFLTLANPLETKNSTLSTEKLRKKDYNRSAEQLGPMAVWGVTVKGEWARIVY